MKNLLPAGVLIGLLLMAGCRNYEPVGSTDSIRIAIAPIINDSEIAQIIAPLSRNVREQLAHSGSFDLVDEKQAEAILRLRVVSLNRRALARDPEDTGRPLSYREIVRVAIEWESDLPAPWGEEAVTRVESELLLYAQPALVTAEASAVTELCDDLSRKIVDRLNWPSAN